MLKDYLFGKNQAFLSYKLLGEILSVYKVSMTRVKKLEKVDAIAGP